jgi:hypothetical protein
METLDHRGCLGYSDRSIVCIDGVETRRSDQWLDGHRGAPRHAAGHHSAGPGGVETIATGRRSYEEA